MHKDRFICLARTRASWGHKAPEHTSAKGIATTTREWIQFALILFGSGWAIYTFIFKEIWAPKAAPVNISMELSLKQAGRSEIDAGREKKALLAVEFKASARNPSSRSIYLLDNAWTAYGTKIASTKIDENTLIMIANSGFAVRNGSTPIAAKYFATFGQPSLVGAGRLFGDYVLNPGEVINRTIVFYVPLGDYDLIVVQAQIPSSDRDDTIVRWSIDPGGTKPEVFRRGSGGQPELVVLDSEGNLPADVGVQMYRASAAVSLWPGE